MITMKWFYVAMVLASSRHNWMKENNIFDDNCSKEHNDIVIIPQGAIESERKVKLQFKATMLAL